MNYKVIRRFRDKYTGAKYSPGDLFTSDDTARIEDLIKRELIESKVDLEALSKKELQAMLDKNGIEYANKMTKNELLELLGGE